MHGHGRHPDAFLRVSPNSQASTDDTDNKEKGIGLGMGEGNLNQAENGKCDAKKNAVVKLHRQRAIEATRTDVHGNRANDADGVQAGEGGKACRRNKHDDRQANRNYERNYRDTVAIEDRELRRHLAITRDHVKQTDHSNNGGVGCAQQ